MNGDRIADTIPEPRTPQIVSYPRPWNHDRTILHGPRQIYDAEGKNVMLAPDWQTAENTCNAMNRVFPGR